MTEGIPPMGMGVKIEHPEKPEQLGFFYGFLLLLSFVLVGFTLWLLVSESLGQSLPSFLRVSVGV